MRTNLDAEAEIESLKGQVVALKERHEAYVEVTYSVIDSYKTNIAALQAEIKKLKGMLLNNEMLKTLRQDMGNKDNDAFMEAWNRLKNQTEYVWLAQAEEAGR